uniref:DEK_C domain-containing protein n=1 Tax=Syphacia muris TaxID=451379 RepID=A0A158R4N9_9BILA
MSTNEEKGSADELVQVKQPEGEPSKAELEPRTEKVEDEQSIKEQENSKEPLKKGLLDKPLVIEGKRERHSVNRLISEPVTVPKKPALEVSGTGLCLGDIEFVNFAINKVHSERLKTFHRILYGSQGKNGLRKKNLRKFNGFGFEVGSAGFEKKKALLMKLNVSEVHDIRRILGSESGHNKAEEVMNILKFLQKPCDLGAKVPKSKRKKRGLKSSSSSKKPKKAKVISTAKVDNDDSDDSSNSDDDTENVNAQESNSEEKKRKKVNKTAKQVKFSKEPATIETDKNTKNNAESDEKLAEASSVAPSSSEGGDTEKWGPGGPTDSEMNTTIHEILRSVDLVDCTMNQMCQRVAEKFPNLDMLRYKRALKERVKEALNEI